MSTSPHPKAFDLSKESWDADYAKVWNGVYILCEPHLPGGISAAGFINNRGFVFEVETPELGKHFLMSGIPGHNCIPKMQKLEKDTGIPLKVVVTSGDFHHMAMKYWLEEYPQTKFIHSSLKFPQTRNGADILKKSKFQKQIELVNGDSFESLEPYSDIVRFYGFNQCETLPDKGFMSTDSKNLTKQSTFSYLRNVASEAGKDDDKIKFLCVWLYHVPSKTLVMEHNFEMFINKELKKTMPWFGKLAFPTEKFASVGKGPIPKLPSNEKDCRKHCQQMQTIVDLDVRTILDYHCAPGTVARRWASKSKYQAELMSVLSQTGEDNPDGSGLFMFMNKKVSLCC